MVHYSIPINVGIDHTDSLGDGYSINVRWFRAYPDSHLNNVAYNIYYSTIKEHVFSDGIKFVSIDDALEANIIDLIPGQDYFFSVRPVEYDPNTYNLNLLSIAYDNLRYYPFSLLKRNMTNFDLTIQLMDIDGFPNFGTVKVGTELINYSSIDISTKSLIISNINNRGIKDTNIRKHNTDGYDGYFVQNPIVTLFTPGEQNIFDRIYICQSRFEYPNYSFTMVDGYKQVLHDILSTDLSISDASNVDFPMYDYAGYHRVNPVDLLSGNCAGSYIGGEQGCIDGYGVVHMVRGLPFQDRNNQRQEMLLNVTGRPAVLLKRVKTGIVCHCYLPSSEYPDDRCPICMGGKFVLSWEQYFNPRRSDGRILVRVNTAEENLKIQEAGFESEFPLDLWTLTVPTIKTRDILILFDQNDNEEFRYEVMGVSRNNLIVGLQGGQKFKVTRIRKTDSAYQILAFKDTAKYPSKLNTSIGFAVGIPHHTHTITKNENDPGTWAQITSISQGHSHNVSTKNGIPEVLISLGHTHQIIL